jgi:hypothetical protein
MRQKNKKSNKSTPIKSVGRKQSKTPLGSESAIDEQDEIAAHSSRHQKVRKAVMDIEANGTKQEIFTESGGQMMGDPMNHSV